MAKTPHTGCWPYSSGHPRARGSIAAMKQKKPARKPCVICKKTTFPHVCVKSCGR